MRILIAYDGSECSDAAMIDLPRAGLPAVAEASVLSVAEMAPHFVVAPYAPTLTCRDMVLPESMEAEASGIHQLQQAKAQAEQAADRLRADFPGWKISSEALVDAPGAAIIRKVNAWRPDLIVTGSHGRIGIRRLALGSMSQHILHHSTCSVRISRHRLHSANRSIRLIVGVDGSHCARSAVQTVLSRNWPTDTEARVVGVLDSRIPLAAAATPEGAIPASIEDESIRRLSAAVHDAHQLLAASGLTVTHEILTGIPCEILLAEAEKWAADCIFVGDRGLSTLKRFLLGSVSTTIASHANCSVEVIRSPASALAP